MKTSRDVTQYVYPEESPRSTNYSVTVNGVEQFVYSTGVADFVCVSGNGRLDVTVACYFDVSAASVRPLNSRITANVEGERVSLSVDRPMNIWIDIEGGRKLYLFASSADVNVPRPETAGVHYFKAGSSYDVGCMRVSSGETVYIEGGAVVRGCILSTDSSDVHIRGNGIFDGSYFGPSNKQRSILFEQCRNVTVEDIVMIDPSVWMVVFTSCRDITVRNLRQLGEVQSSDGVDIVGSSNVLVDGCFISNNDDCVVVKAFAPSRTQGPACDVDNVVVQNCVFINDRVGHAMEIGHELCTASVRNVTFRNCDVLSVHGHGAVFAIHNGDWAVVSDILWEDIRVEHHYDKLVDFRVMRSRYTNPDRRGWIRNVRLRNVQVWRTPYNEGYTTSLIGGYDAAHTVDNIVFENFCVDGVKIEDTDALDLFVKQANGIEFA